MQVLNDMNFFFRIYFYCPVVPIFLLMLYLYPECINNFIKLLAVCYSSPFVMIIENNYQLDRRKAGSGTECVRKNLKHRLARAYKRFNNFTEATSVVDHETLKLLFNCTTMF